MPGTTNGNTAQARSRKRQRRSPIAQSQNPIAQSQNPTAQAGSRKRQRRSTIAQNQSPIAQNQGPIAQSQSPSQSKTPIVAQSQSPSRLLGVASTHTTFFVNRKHASEHSLGGTYSGQMYVDFYEPLYAFAPNLQRNIVFLHGDFFTGQVSLLFSLFL